MFDEFFSRHSSGGSHYVFALAFIWTTIAVTITPLREGEAHRSKRSRGADHPPTLFAHVHRPLHARRTAPTASASTISRPPGPCSSPSRPSSSTTSSASSFRQQRPEKSGAHSMTSPPPSLAHQTLTLVLCSVPIVAFLAVLPAERITSLGRLHRGGRRASSHLQRPRLRPMGRYVLCSTRPRFSAPSRPPVSYRVLLQNAGPASVLRRRSRRRALACLDGTRPRYLGRRSSAPRHPVAHVPRLERSRNSDNFHTPSLRNQRKQTSAYFSVVLSLFSQFLLALQNLAYFTALRQASQLRIQTWCVQPLRVPARAAGA